MTVTIMPFGARIFVEDLEPETSLQKRAEDAGLYIVSLDENIPKPTSGRVIAVGTDPLIQEHVSVGDVVTFARHAGLDQYVEGRRYRSLEIREIIAVIKGLAVPVPTPQASATETPSQPQSGLVTPPPVPE